MDIIDTNIDILSLKTGVPDDQLRMLSAFVVCAIFGFFHRSLIRGIPTYANTRSTTQNVLRGYSRGPTYILCVQGGYSKYPSTDRHCLLHGQASWQEGSIVGICRNHCICGYSSYLSIIRRLWRLETRCDD